MGCRDLCSTPEATMYGPEISVIWVGNELFLQFLDFTGMLLSYIVSHNLWNFNDTLMMQMSTYLIELLIPAYQVLYVTTGEPCGVPQGSTLSPFLFP